MPLCGRPGQACATLGRQTLLTSHVVASRRVDQQRGQLVAVHGMKVAGTPCVCCWPGQVRPAAARSAESAWPLLCTGSAVGGCRRTQCF